MKNYIIENNIDFFKEINLDSDTGSDSETEDNKSEDYCLIGNNKLTYNYIKLPCGHTFNYDVLFDEIVNQKKYNSIDRYALKNNQLKCPYCRKIHSKILPLLPLGRFKTRHYGVNYPLIFGMSGHKCRHIFKSGKNKGNCCEKTAYETKNGTYCPTHHRVVEKNLNKVANKKTTDIINAKTSNLSQYEILNKLTVKGLKEMLKEYKLRVGGKKNELINRIIDHEAENKVVST